MKNLSIGHTFAGGDALRTSKKTRTALVGIAWLATLTLSTLPLVVAQDLLGLQLPWIRPVWVGIALLFLASAFAWPALHPLRKYFSVMLVVLVFIYGIDPWIKQSSAWQNLLAAQNALYEVFFERLVLILGTFIVLLAAILSGLSRRDLFLSIGKLTATVQGLPVPGKRRLTWPFFAGIVTLLLGGLFFSFLVQLNPGALSQPAKILRWLPMILICAALNAFGEEATYRAAPLGALLPVTGPTQAIWMTSIWFGLGHYYGGIPSGPMGAVAAGVIGLVMGKAMVDSRGIVLPWIIHVVIDTIIYIFIAGAM